MNWINLSERQPDDKSNSLIMRLCLTKEVCRQVLISDDYWSYLDAMGNPYGKLPLSDIEWLDESEQVTNLYELQAKRFNEGEINLSRYISICFPDVPTKIYAEEEVLRLLAEQHRNTRHDAIDIILDKAVRANNPVYSFIAVELERAIMNLPQRKPEET